MLQIAVQITGHIYCGNPRFKALFSGESGDTVYCRVQMYCIVELLLLRLIAMVFTVDERKSMDKSYPILAW
jgi:hypothetical protein